MTALLIDIAGLTKKYPGVVALDAIDFDLTEGEVHAVVGHNGAGKSTLVKIIAGDITGDSDRFDVAGTPARFRAPADAIGAGVRLVTQERSLVPPLSVAENILLGRLPRSALRLVDWPAAYRQAADVLDDLGVDLPLSTPVMQLRPAQQTLVEIAKALSADAKVLLLDEPTSSISEQETRHLFAMVRRMRDKGVGIILISHRIADIVSIADRITVLRDGRIAYIGPVAGLETRDIARVMSGDEAMGIRDAPVPPAVTSSFHDVLSATDIASDGYLDGVSLSLRSGEILGVFGLVGSGAVELPYAIFGALPRTGEVRLDNMSLTDPRSSVAAGVGFVPADRSEGVFALHHLARNLGAASLRDYTRSGIFRSRLEQDAAHRWIEGLSITPPLPHRLISAFSGGNQQKALVGRWLARGIRVLLLSEPTRGVDVAARAAIHDLIRDLAAGGVAVVVASTDLDEVVDISHRIMVLSSGRLVHEFDREGRRDEVFHAAAG